MYIALAEFTINIEQLVTRDGRITDAADRSNTEDVIQQSMVATLQAYNQMTQQGDWTNASINLARAQQAIQYFHEMASVMSIRSGSIVLLLAFISQQKLELFWHKLITGEVRMRLHDYLINEEILEKFHCTDIDISVQMDEKNYEKARVMLGN